MKKGFTLIELLAVIVVLAIIALIATPQILNVVEKARKGAAVSSAYGYIDAVEKYIVMHNIDSTKYPLNLEKNQTYQISRKQFKANLSLGLIDKVYAEETIYLNDYISVKGAKPSSGTVTIGNNNTVENANIVTNGYLVVCEAKKCKAKRKMVLDKTAPVITLGEVTSTKNSITVNYVANDPESGIDHVKCYYKESIDNDYTNSVDGNDGVCNITHLIADTDYDYKIEATNGDGVVEKVNNTFKTKPYPTYEIGQAINYDPTTNALCENPVSTPGTKTGCMKWYVIKDNKSSVDVILDHNTTAKIKYDPNYYVVLEKASVKKQLDTDTTGWASGLNPRFITANEIAAITENTGFDNATASINQYFYFGSNNVTAYNKMTAEQKAKQESLHWLFDYTSGCTSYGCNIADSSTLGYWTSSSVYNTAYCVWAVYSNGYLNYPGTSDANYGIRPVITISKSLLN